MKFKITVTQIVPDEALDHDDRDENPQGTYNFEAETKDVALCSFHDTIPIACLDDFEITIEEVLCNAEKFIENIDKKKPTKRKPKMKKKVIKVKTPDKVNVVFAVVAGVVEEVSVIKSDKKANKLRLELKDKHKGDDNTDVFHFGAEVE